MMKTWINIWTLLWVLCAGAVAAAADVAPDELVRVNIQELLDILKQDKEVKAGNQERVMELADAKVLPHFDMKRMTMLAVGKTWRTATPEQQQALTKEFSSLLVRTYSNALATYKNQTIEVKPVNMQPSDTEVTVKTQVNQSNGQVIPIDYRMEKIDGGWKAFDVSVDGVSLVTNYRSSFSNEIRQAGIDGLLKTLVDKNQALAGGKTGKK